MSFSLGVIDIIAIANYKYVKGGESMDDLKKITYKNNFLSQVVVRIDFLQFIPNESAFSADIEKSILKVFPRKGKDQIIRFNSVNLTFDAAHLGVPNANGQIYEGIQREYLAQEENNKLILSNKFIVFEINQYDTFGTHMQWFRDILVSFFLQNRVTAIRTGIRYINLFDSEKIKLQKNFFASDIAATLVTKLPDDEHEMSLIRSMHMSEYRLPTMTLNFRYGMFNPEYPNVLRKNNFALDYDCFTTDQLESADEILRNLENGHQAIQYLFENAITDTMRKVMNGERLLR